MGRPPDTNTVFIVIVTIALAVVGWLIAADRFERGGEPTRKVVYSSFSVSDPLRAVSREGSPISVSMRSTDRKIEDLRVVTTFLTNVGSAPITPSDIVEPISIISNEGWEIINVVSTGNRIETSWEKVDEKKFASKPILLNPGDTLIAEVYMTFDADDPPQFESNQDVISWGGRVINVKEFVEDERNYDGIGQLNGPIVVVLWIWPIILVLILFSISSFHVVSSFLKFGVASNHYSLYILVCALIVNLCASEATATLVFGTSPFRYENPSWLLNFPIIFIALIQFTAIRIAKKKAFKFAI